MKAMQTERSADIAIVGAGIVGLAHALEAAKQGMKVVLFERERRALGASIRNFGQILPVGMPPALRNRALRSRAIWDEVIAEAGLWSDPSGSLLAVFHETELAVIREFCELAPALGYTCELLSADQVLARAPAVNPCGLLGGLYSPDEITVDPREAIAKLPDYLVRRYGVEVHFGAAVTAIDLPHLQAGGEIWRVGRAVVCNGSDFETLYPAQFAASGLTRCKLQMMRTAPQAAGWRIGPMLLTGYSLRHYAAFEICPSLPAVRDYVRREHEPLEQWGIHLLASQNGLGEVVLGDSHEYGLALSPFNSEEVDQTLLNYLQRVFVFPNFTIAARWHGIYAKHPTLPAYVADPAPNVQIVTGLGGIGMTTSFGLAHEVLG